MSLILNGNAPVPALGLSIGIVGHRPDRLIDQGAIAARLDHMLATIEAALADLARDGAYRETCRPRLVSALAEGADRIAASVALHRGMPLVAVLPFAPSLYEGDFADDGSREAFRALLGSAEATIVLDGAVDARERAYDRAGLVMLDNVDLLIAVWDGGPGRGRGGTREVIEEAARRGIAVLTVSTDGSEVELRSSGTGALPMRFADVPRLALDQLPRFISEIGSLSAERNEASEWTWLAQTPRFGFGHFAYPLLMRLTGGRRSAGRAERNGATASNGLEAAFAWWDRAAVGAAQAFRSAVIVNFVLAALAVVLAAGSLLAGHAKWLFVAVEILTILLLLANTKAARKQNWQDRWLESREVAELLRVVSIRRMVGIGRLSGAAGTGWTGRYVAAHSRAAPPLSLDLCEPHAAAAPAIAEVREQAEWNAATARRMHHVSHVIERFGEVLFALVLVACVGWLALYLARPELATLLKYPLTALTAGLPAIATGSYGIRVIIDFEGIAERSHRIADRLGALLARVEAPDLNAEGLAAFARGASATMIADVAAWRLLAEGRRLTIPG